MSNPKQTHLHPIEKAGTLDSSFRRLVQNPQKIVEKYIQPGMTILDLGCGTGYFTLAMAKLLGNSGKVVAVDVQEGMLDILRQKLKSSEQKYKVQIHKCQKNCLGLTEKVNFVLAFYAFHEIECLDTTITELKALLKPEGKILIAEQKFHVNQFTFNTYIQKMKDNGFRICERPRVFFSRAVIMETP